jgi:hypothetical protein
MLIMSFMLGEAGISCLEMPGEAMNLNIRYRKSNPGLHVNNIHYRKDLYTTKKSPLPHI